MNHSDGLIDLSLKAINDIALQVDTEDNRQKTRIVVNTKWPSASLDDFRVVLSHLWRAQLMAVFGGRERLNDIKNNWNPYLMPSCNNIVHWHFVPVGVVVVLAADIVVIDTLKRLRCVFGLHFPTNKKKFYQSARDCVLNKSKYRMTAVIAYTFRVEPLHTSRQLLNSDSAAPASM